MSMHRSVLLLIVDWSDSGSRLECSLQWHRQNPGGHVALRHPKPFHVRHYTVFSKIMQRSQKYLDVNLKHRGTNNSGHSELVTWVKKDYKLVTGV